MTGIGRTIAAAASATTTPGDRRGQRPRRDRIQPHAERGAHRRAVGRADAVGQKRRSERRRQGDGDAHPGARDTEPEHRRAPGVGDHEGAERQHQRGGQGDPLGRASAIGVLGDAQHEPVNAAVDARHARDHARRHPVGRPRRQPLDDVGHQQAGVADLQGEPAGVRVERRAMGIERCAAHQRTELRRPDDGARGELDDRSQRPRGRGGRRPPRRSAGARRRHGPARPPASPPRGRRTGPRRRPCGRRRRARRRWRAPAR